MNTFRHPYPKRDLAVQACAGVVRQVRRHCATLTSARMVLFTTDWTTVGHGRAFTWMAPTNSSGWKMVEPLGLTSFPIYRHDRLGD